MKAIFQKIIAFFSGVSQKIIAALPDIVAAAEVALQTGKITEAGRKDFAMKVVEVLCRQWNVKLNWLTKLAISWAIDKLAAILPPKIGKADYVIPEYIIKITKSF